MSSGKITIITKTEDRKTFKQQTFVLVSYTKKTRFHTKKGGDPVIDVKLLRALILVFHLTETTKQLSNGSGANILHVTMQCRNEHSQYYRRIVPDFLS